MAFAAILFCISVFTLPWLVRPVLALSLVLGAVASHFQDRLGVVIDRDMLQNALNTTGNESRHLFTTDFVLHLVIFGLVPAGLVLSGVDDAVTDGVGGSRWARARGRIVQSTLVFHP